MSANDDGLSVELTVAVPAPPAELFRYFIDPALYVTWMGKSVHLDPILGGAYYVEMSDGFAASGTFTELDPPHRLAFTWGWAPGAGQAVLGPPQDDSALPPGSSLVSVALDEDVAGTRLTLRHSKLLTDELREAHLVAWQSYLNRLVIRARGGDPGPDPHA